MFNDNLQQVMFNGKLEVILKVSYLKPDNKS